MEKLIVLIQQYPDWVKIIVVILVIAIFVLLVFFRKTQVDISSTDFTVQPINRIGENIMKEDKGKRDEFFVNTHFNLTSVYAVEIINIDLQYNVDRAMPMRQTINFDNGPEEEMDASHRMKNRRKVNKNGIINVFVSRRFKCDPVWIEDYQGLKVEMELTSPDWRGIKKLRISGKLQPGGKLDEVNLNLLDN